MPEKFPLVKWTVHSVNGFHAETKTLCKLLMSVTAAFEKGGYFPEGPDAVEKPRNPINHFLSRSDL